MKIQGNVNCFFFYVKGVVVSFFFFMKIRMKRCVDVKGGESSGQFQWFAIAKIEL